MYSSELGNIYQLLHYVVLECICIIVISIEHNAHSYVFLQAPVCRRMHAYICDLTKSTCCDSILSIAAVN